MNNTSIRNYLWGAVIFAGMFVLSRHNYLLFHTLAEIFAVVVAWSVFVMVLNTRLISNNSELMMLGVAYAGIGFIDLLHTLAYKGMGVLTTTENANLATQLWIAARGVESLSLLMFPFVLGRRIQFQVLVVGYATLTMLLLSSIFLWQIFPDCYTTNQGLTPFKRITEYGICVVLLFAMFFLYKRRHGLDVGVYQMMMWSMCVTVVSELSFCLYTDVYGFMNAVGHFLKMISFVLIYSALVATSVSRPQTTVFRMLDRENEALSNDNQQTELLLRVSTLFRQSSSLRDTLRGLPELIASHFDLPIVAIELYDSELETMEFVGSVGISDSVEHTLRIPADQSISGVVARTGKVYNRLDITNDIHYRASALRALAVKTFVCVPIAISEGVWGTLALADRKTRPDIVDTVQLPQVLADNLGQEIVRRKKEDALQRLIDNTSIGFISFDTQGKIILLNDHMATAFCGHPTDFVGKTVTQVFPKMGESLLARFARIVSQKTSAQYEDAFSLPGGTRWFSYELKSVSEPRGDVTGIQAVFIDVTLRRQSEIALENSKTMIETIMEHCPLIIFEIDRVGIIASINRTPAGVSKDDIIGKSMYRFMDKKFHDNVKAIVHDVFDNGKASTYETVGIGPGGEEASYYSTIAPHSGGNGQINSAYILTLDITENKKIKQELEQNRALALRADRLRSLGQMAAGVAHELNQPLVGVRGLAQHMLIAASRGWAVEVEELKSKMSNIIKQADRMNHIIQHLRIFARDAGKPDVQEVDVNDVIRSVSGLLGRQFEVHGIKLVFEFARGLPPVLINPFSLEEVLLNLLLNARDAVEDKKLAQSNSEPACVSVHSRFDGSDTERPVKIVVIDTGTGISETDLNRIFDPFFTTKPPDKGTGLGLPVAKSIMEMFEGTLTIDSVPSYSTTAVIALPALQSTQNSHNLS